MPFGNVVLNGVAMAAVWLTGSGLGAMLGNLAAVVFGKSAEKRSQWIAVGGALGCGWGFLAMVLAIGIVTRL
jgi:glycopeptide antibiotics resistance protein